MSAKSATDAPATPLVAAIHTMPAMGLALTGLALGGAAIAYGGAAIGGLGVLIALAIVCAGAWVERKLRLEEALKQSFPLLLVLVGAWLFSTGTTWSQLSIANFLHDLFGIDAVQMNSAGKPMYTHAPTLMRVPMVFGGLIGFMVGMFMLFEKPTWLSLWFGVCSMVLILVAYIVFGVIAVINGTATPSSVYAIVFGLGLLLAAFATLRGIRIGWAFLLSTAIVLAFTHFFGVPTLSSRLAVSRPDAAWLMALPMAAAVLLTVNRRRFSDGA